MIKISQEDFEEKIEEVLSGKVSMDVLIAKLKTDSRTLNNEIIVRLSINNPELYKKYVEQRPFRAKERNDIDYEALVIEMVKESMLTSVAAEKYGIGERTIRRKVKELEKINPSLISIYREVKKNNKNNITQSKKLQAQIDELVSRPVKISDINENRKKELEQIEKTFNERYEIYGSKEKAAQSMGLTANRIYKLLNELYRIEIEEDTKSFKESIKVEVNSNAKPVTSIKEKTELQIEGEEK